MQPPLPAPDDTRLRALAVSRLLHHSELGTLAPGHTRAVCDAFGVTSRTVRRWMKNAAANNGTYTPQGRPAYQLTDHAIEVIARLRGNVTAAYKELKEEPFKDEKLPSPATFHRAAQRHWNKGQRAGLSGGESARRRYDIHGEREHHHRNYAWETDHVEASVPVILDGHVRKPWITWFIDCATKCICGVAITPQTPSRESILVALRDAILTEAPHNPYGGIPDRIRVDGGRDFLSRTVGQALGSLGTETHRAAAPPPRPESHRRSSQRRHQKNPLRRLPRLHRSPHPVRRQTRRPDQPLLHFEGFVALVLDWIRKRNTVHTMDKLDGKTPEQAWTDDLTPIFDVPAEDLHTLTLERAGKPLTINNSGVRWRKRDYIAEWMHGHAGEKVHLRHLLHHDHRVELYEPGTLRHLGPAFLTDQVTPAQRRALDRARRSEADRLRNALKKAERNRNARYEAVTEARPPRRLDALTQDEATEQLRELNATSQAFEPLPDFIPLPEPSDDLTMPLDHRPNQPEDEHPDDQTGLRT
ncbi:Mu transposase C-terminal domain-containing protein [Streptomyces yatensis]|uniref:Mu transposase C-terminal domain-containing protein n=1 Tax=Streptomyces yatensis TaxID=155177 RepID=UPI001FE8462C|nr:Mu transposase C-terminal domain-containing protein [Streptomyces yatensis]